MKTTRILFILSAAAMLAYGIHQKEYLAVWRKAATICLECIGIG